MLSQGARVHLHVQQQGSDEPAPGNWRDSPKKAKNQKRDENRASGSRLRHLPDTLEEVTDNLEDPGVPAPEQFLAHSRVPPLERFCELMTADHKVLNE